jgi:putative methionine-R-sulfoxide reductase with GAF domain
MNILSTSNSTSPEKHFGFWGNLPLARKILLAFGVLFLLTGILAVVILSGLNRTTAAYEDALAQGIQVRRLSDQLTISVLQARRAEKNFILRWQKEGIYTAYENYVTLHPQDVTSTRGPTYLQNISTMRELIKQLDTFGPVAGTVSTGSTTQAEYEADIALLTQNVDTYERNFLNLVEAYQKKGFDDSADFENQFRIAASNIDGELFYGQVGLEQAKITFLRLRFSEKSYLSNSDPAYAVEVHTFVPLLKDLIATNSQLEPAAKTELLIQTDDYLTAFDNLVALDKEIAIHNEELIASARAVESLAAKIKTLGDQLAADGVNTAKTNSTQTFTFSIITVFIVLVASVVLALTLSQQLTRPILSLTKTAREISGGKFDTQAQVNSADEVGTLAKTFNIMTTRLGQTFAEVNRRAADLATVAEVGTATATNLDTNQLLQAVVDLTKERFNLYHSHIYLLDEAGENLVLARGAGEAGRQMKEKGLSIPLNREHSLVARAARERKGVTVNDVTKAADFLPNPLLPGTRSELAVPMIVGGKVIGVFDVQSDVVGRFTESDINIQTTLAAQVSTSIQNARFFEQSKAQADLESLVNSIGQKIQRATTVDDTLQTAIREIGLALGASRVQASITSRKDASNDFNNN